MVLFTINADNVMEGIPMNLITKLLSKVYIIKLKVCDKGILFHNVKSSHVPLNVTFLAKGKVEIDSCILSENVLISASTEDAEIKIGRDFFCNRNCIIASRHRIDIGNNVILGPNVLIYDHDHNYNENGWIHEGELPLFKVGSVSIGNDVWIGGGTIILRNTEIGDNCVIGAGCIVKGSIPANSRVVSDRANRVEPLRKIEG